MPASVALAALADVSSLGRITRPLSEAREHRRAGARNVKLSSLAVSKSIASSPRTHDAFSQAISRRSPRS